MSSLVPLPGAKKLLSRGTFFVKQNLLEENTTSSREIPEGYSLDDYSIEFQLCKLEGVSTLYHVCYDEKSNYLSLLSLRPEVLPRGMDVYSVLNTLYTSKFKNFLPAFGCDFVVQKPPGNYNNSQSPVVEPAVGNHIIITEPCYPLYSSMSNFCQEFQKLGQLGGTTSSSTTSVLQGCIVCRIFSQLIGFLKLTHSEECMGWFNLQEFFVYQGYSQIKFFNLGFQFKDNLTRQQKIEKDFRELGKVLDRIIFGQPGIAQNQSSIGQNQSGIAQNQSGIGQNQSGIAQNQSSIGQNLLPSDFDVNKVEDGLFISNEVQDDSQYGDNFQNQSMSHTSLHSKAQPAQPMMLNQTYSKMQPSQNKFEPLQSLMYYPEEAGLYDGNAGEFLLSQIPSLLDFRETLYKMRSLEEAEKHPFMVEFTARDRIDSLYSMVKTCGHALNGNLMDRNLILREITRLDPKPHSKTDHNSKTGQTKAGNINRTAAHNSSGNSTAGPAAGEEVARTFSGNSQNSQIPEKPVSITVQPRMRPSSVGSHMTSMKSRMSMSGMSQNGMSQNGMSQNGMSQNGMSQGGFSQLGGSQMGGSQLGGRTRVSMVPTMSVIPETMIAGKRNSDWV